MQPEDDNVQDIVSARPYRRAARAYVRKGHISPLPLPPRAKERPPREYTGRGAPYPTEENIDEWIETQPTGNICLRLGTVDLAATDARVKQLLAADVQLTAAKGNNGGNKYLFDVVGIDVDDYISGGKQKNGGTQLSALQNTYGPLPDTYRSTSRGIENVSGIRFYLAPAGLRYRGKADKDIDIISPSYRYAIVYPSWHPEDRQYRFVTPTGSYVTSLRDIPAAEDFPLLPDSWLEFVTNGKVVDDAVDIDMDTGNTEIVEWARKILPGNNNDYELDGMCPKMHAAVENSKVAIDSDPSSHDKIRDAHWSVIRLASEGHSGYSIAVKRVEAYWKKDVKRRDKRTLTALRQEIWRSKVNALRKLKAEVDKHAADGLDFVATEDTCVIEKSDPNARVVDGITIRRISKDASAYERSDDGNAEHLLALIDNENVRYIPETDTFVFWSEAESRWITDRNGLARRLFRKVRDRQYASSENLLRTAKTCTGRGDDEGARHAKDAAKKMREWADKSGTNRFANAALEAAQSFPKVTKPSEQFDADPLLLGVEGEVIELRPRDPDNPWIRRKAARDNYVTLTTRVPVIDRTELHSGTSEYIEASEAFNAYLNYFLPDAEIRHFAQKVLGYGLLGDNRDRLIVFLSGPTTTGKGTLIGALNSALGDYVGTASMSVFQDHKLNPALAEALPKRVLTLSELSNSAVFHADALKRIAGGLGERMSAELKGSNKTITRMPAFLPIIATNEPPHVRDADEALTRRLVVLPFKRKMPRSREDTSISATLQQHGGPVVLSWLLEGFAFYVREGLDDAMWPGAVKVETASFAMRLSDIGEFVSERIVSRKGSVVTARDVYNAYLEYCGIQNEQTHRVLSDNAFGRRMSALGYRSKKGRVGPPGQRGLPVRHYIDIQLSTSEARLSIAKRQKIGK